MWWEFEPSYKAHSSGDQNMKIENFDAVTFPMQEYQRPPTDTCAEGNVSTIINHFIFLFLDIFNANIHHSIYVHNYIKKPHAVIVDSLRESP